MVYNDLLDKVLELINDEIEFSSQEHDLVDDIIKGLHLGNNYHINRVSYYDHMDQVFTEDDWFDHLNIMQHIEPKDFVHKLVFGSSENNDYAQKLLDELKYWSNTKHLKKDD